MFDLNDIWAVPGFQRISRRIRLRVDRSGGPDACWLWTGAPRKPGGYGQIVVHHDGDQQQTVYPHRAAYILAKGPIPKLINGQVASVLHHCDHPLCCNPKHLFLGNARMNVADKVSKNRQQFGTDHSLAKLNEEKVTAILASSETGVVLARRYSVTPMVISRIRNGLSWRHVKRVTVDA